MKDEPNLARAQPTGSVLEWCPPMMVFEIAKERFVAPMVVWTRGSVASSSVVRVSVDWRLRVRECELLAEAVHLSILSHAL